MVRLCVPSYSLLSFLNTEGVTRELSEIVLTLFQLESSIYILKQTSILNYTDYIDIVCSGLQYKIYGTAHPCNIQSATSSLIQIFLNVGVY